MNMRGWIWGCVVVLMPTPTLALEITFPVNSTLGQEQIIPHDSYEMPIAPWGKNGIKTVSTKGEITRQAWKLASSNLSTLQILDPLVKQLETLGYEIVFQCETEQCGGFDFRYNTDILPEPAMHVDLGDFRYLAARKPGADYPEFVTVFISRSSDAGYVQITRVGAPSPVTTVIESTKSPEPENRFDPDRPIDQILAQQGHFILEDLRFQTGSSALGEGPFDSLRLLANYLKEHPNKHATLVGHTDAEGSLEGNIALSKKRAGSVMNRLIKEFGIPVDQISAEGNGYLSPRATNETEDGRTKNRRVEVILTSTQ